MDKIDSIVYIIKVFYMIFGINYILRKVTQTVHNDNLKVFFLLSLFVSMVCLILKNAMGKVVYSNLFLYFYIFIYSYMVYKKNIGYIIFSNLISYSIYYVCYIIPVSITFFIINIFKIDSKIFYALLIILIQQLLLFLLFKIKRFKNGLQFLKSENTNHYIDSMVVIASSIILYLCSFINYSFDTVSQVNISLKKEHTEVYFYFSILFFAIVMIVIIKESLTTYYSQKLLEKTLKDYESKLKEKDDEIKKLSTEKQKISDLNHKFHNRQEALNLKIEKALMNTNVEIGEEINLNNRIKSLTDEYSNELKKIKIEVNLPKTEIEELDDVFEYMYNECNKNGIEFILQVNGNINYLINNYINQSKFITLVGDHIRDAIIAINYSNNKYKSILAILGIKDDNYEFCIYDSGIEFEIDTLNKLGLERVTTHENSGGTGAGFITTFQTLKEINASFVIEEFDKPNDNNYTKALRFIFDGKSDFKIVTYRYKELKEKLKSSKFKLEEISKKTLR